MLEVLSPLTQTPVMPPGGTILTQTQNEQTIDRFVVGPAFADARAIESAKAGLGQRSEWIVNPVFREGPDGIGAFNRGAAECYAKAPSCPTQRVAIVVDGNVVSAPTIAIAEFKRDQVQISGNFTADSAQALADALNS